MHIGRIVTYLGAAVLGLSMLTPPQARADEWNQKTVFTFQQPVEIPGHVLEPGTYVFKLVDSQSDRNIVEVYDQNEQHLYGTFLAIPNYRLQPTGKPIITFSERAAGSPEAVRAWFYPGENYGHVFVYPKGKARELAKANKHNVVAMAENQNTNQLKQAEVTAEEPSQQETKLGEEYTTPPVQQSQNTEPETVPAQPTTPEPQANREAPPEPVTQTPPPAEPAPAPTQLPQTGSDLPLVAMIGLLSLGAAGSLKLAAAKMK